MVQTWVYAAVLLIPLAVVVILWIIKFLLWFAHARRIKLVVDEYTDEHKPHWIYGHQDIITRSCDHSLKQYVKWAERAKDGVFPFGLGPTSIAVVCHPKTAKKILATSEPKGLVTNTNTGYKYFVPWLGDGLLLSKGDKWYRNRKLLTPGFHYGILKPYLRIYSNCADKLVDTFNQLSAQSGLSVDVFPLVSRCTLNIMRKCAFSSEEDDQNITTQQNPYVSAVNEICQMIVDRIYQPWLFSDTIYRLTSKGKRFYKLCGYTHNVCNKVIRERREELRINGGTKNCERYVDFLDILLLAKDEDGKTLTDQEILDEVETFMFEGHDTTASAISWILYNFARHPKHQVLVQQEISEVMKERKAEISWEDLNKIPYTTRCIKESMRIHPPVPFFYRELSKPLELGGKKLLPGTIIEINPYAIHHNPDVWGSNHLEFDPDRFLPENMTEMDSHSFLPFSAGPRNCIGQNFAMNEIKITIMKIFHKFDVSIDVNNKIEMNPCLVLRAVNGIKLYFKEKE